MKRILVLLAVGLTVLGACGKKKAPVVNAPPPTSSGPAAFPSATSSSTGTVASRPPDPPPVPADPVVRATTISANWDDKPIDAVNGPDSPLKPVFFAYDTEELDEAARSALTANAEVMKTYKTWIVTVEGHSDERGTAEYNLALGDRRALSAKNFLVSLGIAAERLRTVSYGKEFPFDLGHDEAAWTKNRRAHFMLTAKQ